MASFAIQRFLDATISPDGGVISVRFETDTDHPLVLDFATDSLKAAVMPLLGALERAREKAGARATAGPERTSMLLPLQLVSSAADPANGDGDPALELRLAPGRLPLRIALSYDAARDLRVQLDDLLATR